MWILSAQDLNQPRNASAVNYKFSRMRKEIAAGSRHYNGKKQRETHRTEKYSNVICASSEELTGGAQEQSGHVRGSTP